MLAENRLCFEELMEPEALEEESRIQERPVADVLREFQEELEDSERDMKKEFQMARDAEMARMLQAQENHYQPLLPSTQNRPSWNLPDRSQPTKVKMEAPTNPYAPPPRVPGYYPHIGSDDDLQEITADSFNSRAGAPPFRQSGFLNTLNNLHAAYPPNPFLAQNYSRPGYPFQPNHSQSPYAQLSHRPLPWLDESQYISQGVGPYDKAFDLVRNQEEMFDDELDVAYVPFPPETVLFGTNMIIGHTTRKSSLKISRTCSLVSRTSAKRPKQTTMRRPMHFGSH
jgi:hypothetical protein